MLDSLVGSEAQFDEVATVDAALVRAGLQRPVVVRALDGRAHPSLGIRMPDPSLRPRDVADLTCAKTMVPILDVSKQSSSCRCSLGEWAAYWDRAPRARVLNVISFEISGSRLGALVSAPAFVGAVDWVKTAWPASGQAAAVAFVHAGCGCDGGYRVQTTQQARRLLGADVEATEKDAAFDRLLDRRCAFVEANPKRPGTASHARYGRYRAATTLRDVLTRGGTRGDILNDLDKGFATLLDDAAASASASSSSSSSSSPSSSSSSSTNDGDASMAADDEKADHVIAEAPVSSVDDVIMEDGGKSSPSALLPGAEPKEDESGGADMKAARHEAKASRAAKASKAAARAKTTTTESTPEKKLEALIQADLKRLSRAEEEEEEAVAAAKEEVPLAPKRRGGREFAVGAAPRVSKYCLMSVAGSFTDFHVDFGGTSVWYHVLSGRKVFYVAAPTKENLSAFKRWSTSAFQGEVPFAKVAPERTVSRFALEAGDTLVLPSGWIHAVYTPEDSVVFGGNFLCTANVRHQLDIVAVEEALRVPAPQRFPMLDRLCWYAAMRGADALNRASSSSSSSSSVRQGGASTTTEQEDAESSSALVGKKNEGELSPAERAGLRALSRWLRKRAAAAPAADAPPAVLDTRAVVDCLDALLNKGATPIFEGSGVNTGIWDPTYRPPSPAPPPAPKPKPPAPPPAAPIERSTRHQRARKRRLDTDADAAPPVTKVVVVVEKKRPVADPPAPAVPPALPPPPKRARFYIDDVEYAAHTRPKRAPPAPPLEKAEVKRRAENFVKRFVGSARLAFIQQRFEKPTHADDNGPEAKPEPKLPPASEAKPASVAPAPAAPTVAAPAESDIAAAPEPAPAAAPTDGGEEAKKVFKAKALRAAYFKLPPEAKAGQVIALYPRDRAAPINVVVPDYAVEYAMIRCIY